MASEEQKPSMAQAQALLEQSLIQPAPEDGGGAWPSPPTIVGFLFLTFSSAMAVSSWRRGFGAVSFVGFSYLDVVLLFHCLRMYRKTPPGSPRREDLKVAMCLLTNMLAIAVFQLLELLWFLTIGIAENSITDFQNNGPTSPRRHQYPPTIP